MKRVFVVIYCLSLLVLTGCLDRRTEPSTQPDQELVPKRSVPPEPVAVNDTLKPPKADSAVIPLVKPVLPAPDHYVVNLDVKQSIVLVAGVCLAFLVLIFGLYWSTKKQIGRLRARSSAQPLSGKKVEELERKVDELQCKVSDLPRLLEVSLDAALSIAPSVARQPVVATQPHVVEPKELYFSLPRRFEDGNVGFDDAKASTQFVSCESKYRLVVSPDHNVAQVDFVADNFADAINMPADFVDPVCISMGQSTSNTSRIVCVSSGSARLNGGRWIVEQKVKISYE